MNCMGQGFPENSSFSLIWLLADYWTLRKSFSLSGSWVLIYAPDDTEWSERVLVLRLQMARWCVSSLGNAVLFQGHFVDLAFSQWAVVMMMINSSDLLSELFFCINARKRHVFEWLWCGSVLHVNSLTKTWQEIWLKVAQCVSFPVKTHRCQLFNSTKVS